jgi:hypothetical protein
VDTKKDTKEEMRAPVSENKARLIYSAQAFERCVRVELLSPRSLV